MDMDACVIGGSGATDDRLARIGITIGDNCKVIFFVFLGRRVWLVGLAAQI